MSSREPTRPGRRLRDSGVRHLLCFRRPELTKVRSQTTTARPCRLRLRSPAPTSSSTCSSTTPASLLSRCPPWALSPRSRRTLTAVRLRLHAVPSPPSQRQRTSAQDFSTERSDGAYRGTAKRTEWALVGRACGPVGKLYVFFRAAVQSTSTLSRAVSGTDQSHAQSREPHCRPHSKPRSSLASSSRKLRRRSSSFLPSASIVCFNTPHRRLARPRPAQHGCAGRARLPHLGAPRARGRRHQVQRQGAQRSDHLHARWVLPVAC